MCAGRSLKGEDKVSSNWSSVLPRRVNASARPRARVCYPACDKPIIDISCPYFLTKVRIMDGSGWSVAQTRRDRRGTLCPGASGNPARVVIDRAPAGEGDLQSACNFSSRATAAATPGLCPAPDRPASGLYLDAERYDPWRRSGPALRLSPSCRGTSLRHDVIGGVRARSYVARFPRQSIAHCCRRPFARLLSVNE
jgi:hypothetical protein